MQKKVMALCLRVQFFGHPCIYKFGSNDFVEYSFCEMSIALFTIDLDRVFVKYYNLKECHFCI